MSNVTLTNRLSQKWNFSTPRVIDSANAQVRRLSRDNRIKQRRAWLLLGWVTAERSCPCKQPSCPAVGGGSEVTFKPTPRALTGLFITYFGSKGKLKCTKWLVCGLATVMGWAGHAVARYTGLTSCRTDVTVITNLSKIRRKDPVLSLTGPNSTSELCCYGDKGHNYSNEWIVSHNKVMAQQQFLADIVDNKYLRWEYTHENRSVTGCYGDKGHNYSNEWIVSHNKVMAQQQFLVRQSTCLTSIICGFRCYGDKGHNYSNEWIVSHNKVMDQQQFLARQSTCQTSIICGFVAQILCSCYGDKGHNYSNEWIVSHNKVMAQQQFLARQSTCQTSVICGFYHHPSALSHIMEKLRIPTSFRKVAFGELGLLTLPSLYILDDVLYCRFNDVHQLTRDNFCMAQHRTTVRLINRLPLRDQTRVPKVSYKLSTDIRHRSFAKTCAINCQLPRSLCQLANIITETGSDDTGSVTLASRDSRQFLVRHTPHSRRNIHQRRN
ncbi:hypothetical protein J6590_054563 [Homalodisca vitripennis]|nr:hypothetical protein J6590_054563 [Homalodisca vitripennis]